MKLTVEQKKQKNILIKKAKEFKDKNKLISAIDFLIQKDIDPSMIDLKMEFNFENEKIKLDLIVYKNNIEKELNDIMMIISINHLNLKEDTIINVSQNLFNKFKNTFFVLFFDNKKPHLAFKNKYENKMLISLTNEIPSFNWN